jgi:hypothetical protein
MAREDSESEDYEKEEQTFFEDADSDLPESVGAEKHAGNGAFLGLFLLPLFTWGLYKSMAVPGELDDAARLCYVLKRIAPSIMMQWLIYEAFATMRIANSKAGNFPFPWEPEARVGPGKPTLEGIDALNPPFYALYFRAAQNNLESTVMNTFAILCLSLYCDEDMYDVRLPVAFGYIHAFGGFVYQYCYSMLGPNHRMYGFILRGFWNIQAILTFCFIRSFGLMESRPVLLFWICAVGTPFFWMCSIIVVKVKYLAKIPKGEAFGYTVEQYKTWASKQK